MSVLPRLPAPQSFPAAFPCPVLPHTHWVAHSRHSNPSGHLPLVIWPFRVLCDPAAANVRSTVARLNTDHAWCVSIHQSPAQDPRHQHPVTHIGYAQNPPTGPALTTPSISRPFVLCGSKWHKSWFAWTSLSPRSPASSPGSATFSSRCVSSLSSGCTSPVQLLNTGVQSIQDRPALQVPHVDSSPSVLPLRVRLVLHLIPRSASEHQLRFQHMCCGSWLSHLILHGIGSTSS